MHRKRRHPSPIEVARNRDAGFYWFCSTPGNPSIIPRIFGGVIFYLSWVSSGFGQVFYHADQVTSIFDPLSAPAEAIHHISLLVLAIVIGIFVVVAGLLTYTIFKFRRPAGEDGHEPPQVYGSTQIELAWTVLPVLITVVLILITARTIGEIQNAKMPDNALQIRIVGHQWWWEVHYPEFGFVTANEIHIPVSDRDSRRPTHILLQSADVIHSFWVPQLAGKTDLVPNRTNHTWVEPYKIGTYLGNCAEYCGTQHAKMRLRVIVHSPEDFAKWVENQQKPPIDDPRVAAGRKAFLETSCINCHTVDGTVAEGVFGPDLTHLASRETIGAGAALLTPENLKIWVKDPQIIKPGCLMPNMQLTDQEVADITDYLLTLK